MKIRPPARFNVEQDFLKMYKASTDSTMSESADISRLVNLRCSSLPFCPTSLLLDYKTKGLIRSMDMMGALYVGIGTVVHEVLQNYLSRQGQFLADYYCEECGTLYPLSHVHECCGMNTRYMEVEINIFGIMGHIDGIFKDSNGSYWILDFKTASLSQLKKKKTDPGSTYIQQIESYAYLLYKQYGIKVVGVMLCFIPRDNPRSPTVWARPMDDIKLKTIGLRLRKQRDLHRLAMKATTIEDILKLSKHKCGKEYCSYCKMSDVELKSLIKRAFKTKHPLPMEDLRSTLKESPEGIIHISRLNPKPFVRVSIPIKDMKNPDLSGIKTAIKNINKLTAKLENAT